MLEETIEKEILYTISKILLLTLCDTACIDKRDALEIDKKLISHYRPFLEDLEDGDKQ